MSFQQSVYLISCFLLLSTSTLADNSMGGYTASSDAKKVYQRRSLAGGSRSGCKSPLHDDYLTLLVPEEKVVHKSARNQPSLFFYSAASTIPLEFTLVDPQVAEPLISRSLIIEEPGWVEIKLESNVKLEAGKTYLWHIGIRCLSEPENFREVLAAAVEYTPLSEELKVKLALADSKQDLANIYLRNGFWYDALSLLKADANSLQSSNYVQKLLESVNINLPIESLSVRIDNFEGE